MKIMKNIDGKFDKRFVKQKLIKTLQNIETKL